MTRNDQEGTHALSAQNSCKKHSILYSVTQDLFHPKITSPCTVVGGHYSISCSQAQPTREDRKLALLQTRQITCRGLMLTVRPERKSIIGQKLDPKRDLQFLQNQSHHQTYNKTPYPCLQLHPKQLTHSSTPF